MSGIGLAAAAARIAGSTGAGGWLILAGGPGYLTKALPNAAQRSRFIRYVVGRYSAMNVTWQAVDAFDHDSRLDRSLHDQLRAVLRRQVRHNADDASAVLANQRRGFFE